ncbi:MAG: hypothetical protein HYV36_05730 [Lentisphaerae bacterium]|nr:hypothetical protein [Lentisphaerota bacterium]
MKSKQAMEVLVGVLASIFPHPAQEPWSKDMMADYHIMAGHLMKLGEAVARQVLGQTA